MTEKELENFRVKADEFFAKNAVEERGKATKYRKREYVETLESTLQHLEESFRSNRAEEMELLEENERLKGQLYFFETFLSQALAKTIPDTPATREQLRDLAREYPMLCPQLKKILGG